MHHGCQQESIFGLLGKSQEQKGTGAATPTAQERGHSHPVPLLQPCLGEATQKPPEATVGAWIFCPSKGTRSCLDLQC